MQYHLINKIKFFLSVLLISSMCSTSMLAQSPALSKKYQKLLVEAKQNLRLEYYDEAVAQFDQILNKYEDHTDILPLKGEALYRKGDLKEAAKVLEHFQNLSNDGSPNNLYTLGRIYHELFDFENARHYYRSYIESAKGRKKFLDKTTRYLIEIDFMEEAMRHPVAFLPEKIDKTINEDGSSNYLPLFHVDGQTMVFTRRKNGQEDLYYSQKAADGSWESPIAMDDLNTAQNEGAHALSADGNVIIFTACDRPDGVGKCDLYITEKEDGVWAKPKNLGVGLNTAGMETQPSLSADGRTLYFVSTRAGGQGGRDIWYTRRNSEGRWIVPKNMGPTINTKSDDESPHLHLDGQHLYFMSEGHIGMGNADLFLSKKENGRWGKPINLGYPINTPNEEGALSVSPDGKYAYYSTNRDPEDANKMGKRHRIYRFELPESIKPNPVTFGVFKIVDATTEKNIRAEVKVFDTSTKNQVSEFEYLPNGRSMMVSFAHGKNYGAHITSPGYIFKTLNSLDIANLSLQKIDTILVNMHPIISDVETEKNQPIVLRNVFFETGSASLLSASNYELDEIFGLLTDQPNLRIQINGHTDDIGSDEDNMKLSQMRAESVQRYLVDKGIDLDRLSAKGYGETMPVSDNATEAGRGMNRRTEFVIL